MFELQQLRAICERTDFQDDVSVVRQSLVNARLCEPMLQLNGAAGRLRHFAEAVLASVPNWQDSEGRELCRMAGEIAECLSAADSSLLLKAALLYELADLPAISGAIASKASFPSMFEHALLRAGGFESLGFSADELEGFLRAEQPSAAVAALALSAVAEQLLFFEHGFAGLPRTLSTDVFAEAARHLDVGLTASEARALSAVFRRRVWRAVRSCVGAELFESLRKIRCPPELFYAQAYALREGLLDERVRAWGFAAPTGAGKTFLTRVLIADLLQRNSESKVLYLVPSKALVNEVAASLARTLEPIDVSIHALSAQLVDLNDDEHAQVAATEVIVLTPEKADLLLRLEDTLTEDVSLVIVDEAHHIEAGTRGILLELYLWRLRQLSPGTRFVLLSAVAPNIDSIAGWLSTPSQAVIHGDRGTRMRAGVYRVKGAGASARGVIEYVDGTHFEIPGCVSTAKRRGLVELAQVLFRAGPVLVVAKGKRESEKLAAELRELLRKPAADELPELSTHEVVQRLDSRLEREMYGTVAMRDLLRYRIAYHHAGLPPRVRFAVEEAIRAGEIDFVFATTTLAEGVNFPFSSVIVQSLALREAPEKGRPSRYHPVTPRSFWNIAGRAGRPGHDREGQVILFEPSLGLDKVAATMEPYLNPALKDFPAVSSALATALADLASEIRAEEVSLEEISQPVLPRKLSKRAHGALNLLRVGIVHARASNLIQAPEEILDSSFADRFLDDAQKVVAREIIETQSRAVDAYLNDEPEVGLDTIARLGLSIETLSQLREYVVGLAGWQLEAFQRLFFGGVLNIDQARYVVGPVAKRMAELEGPTLGGFYSDIIVEWISGVPFATIKPASADWKKRRIEDLISVVYSRIQYLLPWGLYAFNELVGQEAQIRGVSYNDEIQKLAYLADAGVPSFDALRLTNSGFERVDATRLAKAYRSEGGLSSGMDVIGWVRSQPAADLAKCIRGRDRRRLDFDFNALLKKLAGGV